MPITAYPQYSYWKTADSSETVMAGGFSFQDSQQLRQAVVHLYKHGNGGGSERIRPKLFHDRQLTKLYATGDWFALSGIENLAEYWRGRIGLGFSSKPWIESGRTYYLGLETENYTRSGTTFYLSYMLDLPYQINDNSAGQAVAVEFYGYRTIDGEL